jgi:ATP-dependent Clp endopeptidase proteolytic subunit ClpP
VLDFNTVTGTIRAYGDVGWPDDGFTHEDFMRAFDALAGDDVTIQLHSNGGDVSTGLSIYNQIQDYGGRVEVIVDAMAASIASVFPMAADRVVAHKNSRLMVHNPWSIVMGDAKEFRHTADVLDSLGEDIAESYAERTGRSVSFWKGQMEATSYYKASEALELGLIDDIVGAVEQPKEAAASTKRQPRPRAAALQATIARLKTQQRQLDADRRQL